MKPSTLTYSTQLLLPSSDRSSGKVGKPSLYYSQYGFDTVSYPFPPTRVLYTSPIWGSLILRLVSTPTRFFTDLLLKIKRNVYRTLTASTFPTNPGGRVGRNIGSLYVPWRVRVLNFRLSPTLDKRFKGRSRQRRWHRREVHDHWKGTRVGTSSRLVTDLSLRNSRARIVTGLCHWTSFWDGRNSKTEE